MSRAAPFRLPSFLAAFLYVAIATFAEEKAPAQGGAITILDGSGAWRALHSWNAPLVQTADGVKERRSKSSRADSTERPDFRFMTLHPSAAWTEADFDDSGWARRHLFAKYANGESDERAGGGSGSPYLRQLCLRGKFTVADPAKVGALWLTMAFRGGAAVSLNGKELSRAHLAAGPIEPGSPAEPYPVKACLRDDGKPWHWYDDRVAIQKEAYPLRVRRIEKLAIPANLLRAGTNVLAVEIHAAPYPEALMKAAPAWGTCGLIELHLQRNAVDAGASDPSSPRGSVGTSSMGIEPNTVRPKGLQVWNTNVAEQILDVSWGDPHERLQPVSMAGPRNGVASGRVVVSRDQPMRSLAANVGDLVGPGGAKLPAAVRIWYGKFDSPRGSRWGGSSDWSVLQWGALPRLRDDALLESAPAEVPVSRKALPPSGAPTRLVDGAIQPIWVTVDIPKDAAAGAYRGTLTITVEGEKPVELHVRLNVIDWAVPEPGDYQFWMGMIQSPEAVALTYNVPLWSDKHCELVAKSLDWIGKLGGKVLYVPLGAESQYGNAQSMVLWTRGADGKYAHDFSRVEKYLDLALKHMGKPRFVVAGVWDSCSHVSAPEAMKRRFPRFSVLDTKTGEITTANGPAHGTPESLEFWQPVLTKVREILAARGLAETLLLGFCADQQPDKATVDVFRKILPDSAWQANRHPPIGNDKLPYDGGAVPIRYQANVWGGWDNSDPDTRRVYGWKYPANPSLRTWLDRGLFDSCPVVQFRVACEQALLADRRGLGQIGADFWPVKGPDGKPTATMVGRFPETSEGNLGIYSGQLLYPGPNGPVPTVRYQMMRENIQECEARIFLEKLLLETPLRLPADLAKRVQDVLDERTRWHRLAELRQSPESFLSWPYSGWEARRIRLFEAAAEAARAIAGK